MDFPALPEQSYFLLHSRTRLRSAAKPWKDTISSADLRQSNQWTPATSRRRSTVPRVY